MSSREQVAVAKFAQCLQVIPKTLAINAALDASELVSKVNYYCVFWAHFFFSCAPSTTSLRLTKAEHTSNTAAWTSARVVSAIKRMLVIYNFYIISSLNGLYKNYFQASSSQQRSRQNPSSSRLKPPQLFSESTTLSTSTLLRVNKRATPTRLPPVSSTVKHVTLRLCTFPRIWPPLF